jgi:hypothetical protein
MKKCKHKNIEIHRVSRYIMPKGYEKTMELDDIDLAKYFTEENHDRTVCENCGKILD